MRDFDGSKSRSRSKKPNNHTQFRNKHNEYHATVSTNANTTYITTNQQITVPTWFDTIPTKNKTETELFAWDQDRKDTLAITTILKPIFNGQGMTMKLAMLKHSQQIIQVHSFKLTVNESKKFFENEIDVIATLNFEKHNLAKFFGSFLAGTASDRVREISLGFTHFDFTLEDALYPTTNVDVPQNPKKKCVPKPSKQSLVLTYRQRVEIIKGIANAMAFLHSQSTSTKSRITHGDLKPANVMLSGVTVSRGVAVPPSAKVKPIVSNLRLVTLSKRPNRSGSIRYSAPEYFDHSDVALKFVHKVDSYAYAVIVNEIFAGVRPFNDIAFDDEYGVERAILKGALAIADDLQKLNELSELKQIVTKCLANKNSERPDFANDDVSAIIPVLRNLPLNVVLTEIEPVQTTTDPTRSNAPGFISYILGLGVALSVIQYFSWTTDVSVNIPRSFFDSFNEAQGGLSPPSIW